MSWKALLVEALIMALTTFATVFFRGMAAHYPPDEDFI
ncbi:Inner membrane protein [Leclercia adecarboxylata]